MAQSLQTFACLHPLKIILGLVSKQTGQGESVKIVISRLISENCLHIGQHRLIVVSSGLFTKRCVSLVAAPDKSLTCRS